MKTGFAKLPQTLMNSALLYNDLMRTMAHTTTFPFLSLQLNSFFLPTNLHPWLSWNNNNLNI